MLPYLLAVAGGYLIGNSMNENIYADGGMMAKGGGVKGTYTGRIVNAEIGEVMVGKISGYRGNGEPVYDVHSFGSLRKDIREKKGELSNSKIKELLKKMADGGMMAKGGIAKKYNNLSKEEREELMREHIGVGRTPSSEYEKYEQLSPYHKELVDKHLAMAS